jgi:hypothetical protein
MRPSRAPWWLYLIAASFLGFLTLQIYSYIWGPEPLGLDSANRNGSLVVSRVAPDGAAARAGLRSGDRIVTVGGIPIRRGKRVFDFLIRAKANFESGRPIPFEVERQEVPVEIAVVLRKGTSRDLEWVNWELIGGAVFTLMLALLIGLRRPHDPVARTSALFMACMAFSTCLNAPGWGSEARECVFGGHGDG